MLHKEVWSGEGGYRAEVYDDSTDRRGYWFGSREACEAIDPRAVKLYPMSESESPDPFDLACERRFD